MPGDSGGNPQAFKEGAERLGFHVVPFGHFHTKASSQIRTNQSRLFFSRGNGAMPFDDDGPFLVSNCRVIKFSLPIKVDGRKVQISFSDIEILSHGNPTKPHIDRAVQSLASALVAKRAKIASERLEYLLYKGSAKGVSFEHIASYCGYDSDLLQQLANADITMIEQQKQRIVHTIASTLQRCVPSPDRPIQADGPPTTALKNEIGVFLEQYLQLLKLAYLDIPRLQGSPPSAFVHKESVNDEATKDIYVSSRARLIRGIKRTMEQEEHNRYVM